MDCFGDQKAIKTPKLDTIWLELIARVLNMLIGLKDNNYYLKVFKRVNYKLSNSTFWVVIMYEISNGPYSEKKEFKMNCTRKDFEMLIFKLLNWFAILLISRMCCLIPHTPLYFIVVNLDINMSTSTLFDATNYCSTKVRNSLAFVEA